MWKDSKPRLGDLNIYVGSHDCCVPQPWRSFSLTGHSILPDTQIFQDWSVDFKTTPEMSTAEVKQELLPWYFMVLVFYGVGLTSSSATLEVTPIGADLLSFFRRSP